MCSFSQVFCPWHESGHQTKIFAPLRIQLQLILGCESEGGRRTFQHRFLFHAKSRQHTRFPFTFAIQRSSPSSQGSLGITGGAWEKDILLICTKGQGVGVLVPPQAPTEAYTLYSTISWGRRPLRLATAAAMSVERPRSLPSLLLCPQPHRSPLHSKSERSSVSPTGKSGGGVSVAGFARRLLLALFLSCKQVRRRRCAHYY